MKVMILSHTASPEQMVAAAAKLCYSSVGIDEVLEGLNEEKTRNFIEYLMSLGHESPIEHISFTFGVEGVSRSLLAQLTRHRIASYSVKSQRYVSEGQFGYVTPPAIAEDTEAAAMYEETMAMLQERYDALAARLESRYVSEGADPKAAQKKAIEDARFVLPNACETQLIMTMNARSLLNFFHHRCCNRAQWEIHAMADEMLKLVREICPTLFRYAGPRCASGSCPEGKMTCGKAKEMRERYVDRN